MNGTMNTFLCVYTLIGRYMKKKEYSKAINVVDQANAHCSIQLPLEMAVVYSVSLLHTGRGQDVCSNK